jgi:cyclase
VVNTHFHGDHTGGNKNFQKDGAIVVAHDSIRLRLAAGTTNGTTGAKFPPVPAAGLPKQTYYSGSVTVEVGGRKALVTYVQNAHTDGDSIIYFADANVISVGDIMNNNHRYQQVDFANGGGITGVVRGTEAVLRLSNDGTKIVVGHGPLAKKSDVVAYNAMAKAALERIEKLVREGKTEAEVIAADPLKDLNATWAANPEAAVNFLKQVYNSLNHV